MLKIVEQEGNIKLLYDTETLKYKVKTPKGTSSFTLASLAVDEYFCQVNA